MTDRFFFTIVALANSQTLPRLLEWFAQRGLIPAEVHACIIEDALRVTIVQDGLTEHQAGVIGEKMRSSVMVEHVDIARLASDVRTLEKTV